MDLPYIVISRVNLHMDLDPHKYKVTRLWEQPGWEAERVRLLNEWARASLRKQTVKDFTFISLWQKGHVHHGGEVDGEIKIEIERTGTQDDEPLSYKALWEGGGGKLSLNYSDQIRDKVRELFTGPALVMSLDCDDALRYDFIERVREDYNKIKPNKAFYFSNHDRHCYNIKTGAKGVKQTSRPSPTVTTYEPDIQCYPLRYNHSHLRRFMIGREVPGLLSLQTINSSNMFCKGTGAKCDFNLEDYV